MEPVSDNDSTQIQAIDVHGHFGAYDRVEATDLERQWMSADAAAVAVRAARARVTLTLVSPLEGLLPRGQADPVAANQSAAARVAAVPGLLQWVIVHPQRPETLTQARRMCGRGRVCGIKIHPEEHAYAIATYGDQLMALAAELGAVVLAHSGDGNSRPSEYVPLANAYPEVKMILGHLGNGGDSGRLDLQVRAIQAAQHGNLSVDTSSARSLTPGLIEWAVTEIGAERVLFGSDTPLYFVASQRARIDRAELDLPTRRQILRENALELFGRFTCEEGNPSC